ncbi:hypothetical protein EDB19DRAFT_1906134 [Suillus lakei]|nr:hypothetical protein EDB19DRAFT_1906134 [Suillus lakei]
MALAHGVLYIVVFNAPSSAEMVLLDDTDNEADLPSSCDTIASFSWFSPLPNARTKQARQTVISLIRDLVTATTSDNSAATPILASCASALSPSSFSALLQHPTFDGHTPIYWAILNRHTHILPDMLRYAGPLNKACIADIRLACLASGDQVLFGKLRRGELPFLTTLRADALVLGSTSADDIDVHEVDGEAAFSASIKIRLWQKRMRVAGLVDVEFIAARTHMVAHILLPFLPFSLIRHHSLLVVQEADPGKSHSASWSTALLHS